MIRNSHLARKKTSIQPPLVKKGPKCENVQPAGFNTKGYFTPDEAHENEYIKVKEEVFKKYRNREAEIVFIDPKMTKPCAFIQRGMLIPKN